MNATAVCDVRQLAVQRAAMQRGANNYKILGLHHRTVARPYGQKRVNSSPSGLRHVYPTTATGRIQNGG